MRDWVAEVHGRLTGRGGPQLPQDVVEEVGQHIADLHRSALFQGLSIEAADQLAERELRNIQPIADAIRRRRRSRQGAIGEAGLGAGISRDVSHALRLLGARRGHSTLVVLTLAVGIGACTAVFSLVNALLLGELPYPHPQRLVLLWESDADDPSVQFIASAPNYRDWVSGTSSFEALGIWEYRTFNLSATAEPEQVSGLRASSSLFDVLGVPPAIGRTFTRQEDTPGHRVAVISDAIWKVHFAGEPSVVGRSMRLNGETFEVIGVMPQGFVFPGKNMGVWIPIQFTERDESRDAHSFYVAGRLADGVSFEQARDDVERLGGVLRARYEENEGEGATVQRMDQFGLLNTRRVLIALAGAVALVFLIACLNVASLQLAGGLARRREFMTRLSLGARYGHLVRQVFIEGLVMAGLGGVIGVAIALAITQLADRILASDFRTLPFRGDVPVAIDARVLLFAVVAAALSALLFAFAPLLGLRRRSLQLSFRDGDRRVTRLAAGTRRVLVTIEIALALVVLAGAGVMIRSLSTLLQVDPGFDADRVLVMQVSLPQAETYGPPVRSVFCQDLARELSTIPGIARISAVSHLPLSGANASRGFSIEGRTPPGPNEAGTSASYRLICPEYFATMAISLVAGREFNAQDVRGGPQVVILNRAAAERYWPDANAVGQRIKLGDVDSTNPWMTVVGVVENVRHFELESQPEREMFRPYSQAAWPVMTVVARTAGEPMTWQRPVREALRRVEINLPAGNARSMEDVVGRSVAWRQTPMRLLTGFAFVGLLLAGVGVYGVLAYYVSQRTRELGVRAALGASKQTLITLVLRQSALPVVAGIALGIVGSIASGAVLAELLYEVRPGDPLVLILIAALLAGVALLSGWLPARRAAMVDPVVALREE
jgi:putative ABC transport system permease protein